MIFRFPVWQMGGWLLTDKGTTLAVLYWPLQDRKTAIAAQFQLRQPKMTGHGAQVWLGWGTETKEFRQVGRILLPLPLSSATRNTKT